jgi:methylthioribulose 1-phosphate dehydratase/enolase-phosphatase E1
MSSREEGDRPGEGWSNGDIPPAMYPMTRQGRISLYSAHRRWINLEKSWTRIGTGHEHDFRHSSSGVGEALNETPEQEADTVCSLIAQLCETFYNRGWATGTGGGVSIRVGGETENRPWRVFVAPSGIQKEDMIGHDVFELDMDRNVVTPPLTPNLRQSACTPLWYVVYRNRPSAKCVIHTHSIHAQMATLLDPTETSDTLRITHLEMLKGVGHHAYDDILEIPIIDNRPSEDLLASQLESVIQKFPNCNAVLVRRHGLYVWGDSWEQAKTQCESFDYLFESAICMKQMGMDFSRKPLTGTYRVDAEDEEAPAKKRARVHEDGFHGRQKVDNEEDLRSNAIPILPRDSKILLLDIEGCTTAISYVKDILFPYVLKHVMEYERKMPVTQIQKVTAALMEDARQHGISTALGPTSTPEGVVSQMVHRLMENDVKATGLKALQGQMWKAGTSILHT